MLLLSKEEIIAPRIGAMIERGQLMGFDRFERSSWIGDVEFPTLHAG